MAGSWIEPCGVEGRGAAEFVDCDVTAARAAIASRYLGVANPRAWDLSGILPA